MLENAQKILESCGLSRMHAFKLGKKCIDNVLNLIKTFEHVGNSYVYPSECQHYATNVPKSKKKIEKSKLQ